LSAKKLQQSDYLDLIHKSWADKVEVVPLMKDAPQGPFASHHIGLSNTADIVKNLELFQNSKLMHLVQPNKFDFELELNSSALIAANPNTFFDFPASTILAPQRAGKSAEEEFVFIDFEFNKSSEKHPALILLEVELEKISSNQSLISTVRTIGDELFTNAIYNAPFIGSVGIKGEDRQKVIQLPESKKSRIFLAKDDQRLVVGCVDRYGSLELNRLVDKVHSCFKMGAASQIQMDSKKGAGIGTYMLFEASPSIYVGVDEGQHTVFACVLPMNMSSKKVQELPKSYHFISERGGGES
tara:strand:+ start:58772 stop:59665 length:894 start_codon:yes stop_codon:yes gene_type:complete